MHVTLVTYSEMAKITVGKLNGIKICILPESTLFTSVHETLIIYLACSMENFNTKM